MLDAIKLFVMAARLGSISAAAEALDTTPATASRHLSSLETQLGVRLLNRSARGLSLTVEGETLYDRSAWQIDSLQASLSELLADRDKPQGALKVLAPANFAASSMDQFWPGFIRRYPAIDLTIMSNNSFEDLELARADVAIRVGPQPDSALVQKRLGSVRSIIVCAADYANPPKTIDDLVQHPSIALSVLEQWSLDHQGDAGQHVYGGPHHHRCNDGHVATTLTRAGAGLALLPESFVSGDLAQGTLIRVLPDWQGPVRDVYLVRTHRQSAPARVRVFAEALESFLNQQSWFMSGSAGR